MEPLLHLILRIAAALVLGVHLSVIGVCLVACSTRQNPFGETPRRAPGVLWLDVGHAFPLPLKGLEAQQ
jgi:hypothetical protein